MGWDKGVPYESLYARLVGSIRRGRLPGKCYDAVLLLQLRNGMRISEAVRAFKQFLSTRRLEFEVQLSKKRRPETRLVVVPQEVVDVSRECYHLLDVDDRVLVSRLKTYCRDRHGVNTHTLRYAYITFLLRSGVSPSIVARIVGHSRLDHILTYTQRKTSEEVLRSVG